jgi:hypothetical protein
MLPWRHVVLARGVDVLAREHSMLTAKMFVSGGERDLLPRGSDELTARHGHPGGEGRAPPREGIVLTANHGHAGGEDEKPSREDALLTAKDGHRGGTHRMPSGEEGQLTAKDGHRGGEDEMEPRRQAERTARHEHPGGVHPLLAEKRSDLGREGSVYPRAERAIVRDMGETSVQLFMRIRKELGWWGNRHLARALGVSLRTVERHGVDLLVDPHYAHRLVRLVHAKNADLGEKLARAVGTNVVALGLVPATPEQRRAARGGGIAWPDEVFSVVQAAASAGGLSIEKARSIVGAAVAMAQDMGLTLEQLDPILNPKKPSRR